MKNNQIGSTCSTKREVNRTAGEFSVAGKVVLETIARFERTREGNIPGYTPVINFD